MKRDKDKTRDWQRRSALRSEDNRRQKAKEEREARNRGERKRERELRVTRKTKRSIPTRKENKQTRDNDYKRLREAYVIQRPTCEFDGCRERGQSVHHKAGREGDNLFRHLMHLCNHHHRWVHDNPAAARERGYLLTRHWSNSHRPLDHLEGDQ